MMNVEAPSSTPETDQFLEELWREANEEIVAIKPEQENWKIAKLPLARIRKIMKIEEFVMQELEKDRKKAEAAQKPAAGSTSAVAGMEGVAEADEDAASVDNPTEPSGKTSSKFMLAGEAAIVMSRACELLIRELTGRAWIHTERNRRRTLQRPDLHAAVGESEVYDFLIDIVPRVTAPRPATSAAVGPPQAPPTVMGTAVDDVGIPQIPPPSAQDYSTMAAVLGGQPPQAATAAGMPDFALTAEQQWQQMQQMQQQMQQQAQAGAATGTAVDPNAASQTAKQWTDRSPTLP